MTPPSDRPSGDILGAWQLLSYQVEVQADGDCFTPMGNHPSGYVIFTAEGRLSFTLSAEGRQPAESTAERAALQSSLIAYTGTDRLEQIRFFSISDDLLTVHTPWRMMPNWPERGLTRSIVRFQRCI